jgi:hypothetical protein
VLVNGHTLNDRKGSLAGLPKAIILPTLQHLTAVIEGFGTAQLQTIIASKSTSASVMVVGFWCLGHYPSVTFLRPSATKSMQYGYVKFIVLEVQIYYATVLLLIPLDCIHPRIVKASLNPEPLHLPLPMFSVLPCKRFLHLRSCLSL